MATDISPLVEDLDMVDRVDMVDDDIFDREDSDDGRGDIPVYKSLEGITHVNQPPEDQPHEDQPPENSEDFIIGYDEEDNPISDYIEDLEPIYDNFDITSPLVESESHAEGIVGGRAIVKSQSVAGAVEKFIPARIFHEGECAPQVGNSTGVCSSQTVLERIKRYLEQQDRSIKTHSTRDLIEHAKQATKCESESCLFTKRSPLLEYITPGLAKKELIERFAPKGPHNNTTWLSNDNIDGVLKLYTQKFPHFYHVPYQMADFEKYGGDLASVDHAAVSKSHKSLGCVLNTDHHGGPGQHWVAVYVDFQGGTFEYWDSAGDPPFPEIHDFMIRQVDLMNAGGKRYKHVIVCRDIAHQKLNTECGVYSLYYIINRLNGVPYTFFQQHEIPDAIMHQFRKYLFRHS